MMFCCPDCYVAIDVSLSDCQRQRDGKRQNPVPEGSFRDEVRVVTILQKWLFHGTMICNKTFTRTRTGNSSYEMEIQNNYHLYKMEQAKTSCHVCGSVI